MIQNNFTSIYSARKNMLRKNVKKLSSLNVIVLIITGGSSQIIFSPVIFFCAKWHFLFVLEAFNSASIR